MSQMMSKGLQGTATAIVKWFGEALVAFAEDARLRVLVTYF